MRLTPLDIKKQEFKRSLRGYDSVEVDAFLETLSKQWEDLLEEKERLTRRVQETEMEIQKFKQVENMLHQTLAQAQQSSTAAVENAKREAQLIKQEAQMIAEKMIEQAKNESNLIKDNIQRLQLQRHEIISKLKLLLTSQLELLESLGKDSGLEKGFSELKKETVQKKIEVQETTIKQESKSVPAKMTSQVPTSVPVPPQAPASKPQTSATMKAPDKQENVKFLQVQELEALFTDLDTEENPDMVFQPVPNSQLPSADATRNAGSPAIAKDLMQSKMPESSNKPAEATDDHAPKTTRVEVPLEELKKTSQTHRRLNIDDILDSLE
ncbi:DivIVA family protein [Chloroherpeton thalassium ATCC 35110]|uniref:DivIVA family protein n=1 Tax=Chloroherpeton thalassium (strain ATCC 35110 / GB-78) TaxID=517418 RepID=B3QVS4_CHLT3|nr:DivIVA domain-containing protein [Chloroherpeton thalassium]ACF13131.1 DivIVA family protein [Chloroherpeton thalassium ATCC 35110]